MNRLHPQTLLFVLLGTVPLVVAGAGVVAFLLMRAGYSVMVWAVDGCGARLRAKQGGQDQSWSGRAWIV